MYKHQLLSRYFKPILPCGMLALEKNCPFSPLEQLEVSLGICTHIYVCVYMYIYNGIALLLYMQIRKTS